MTETMPKLTAQQVPALRRKLVAYQHSGHAADMYEMMIRIGRQRIAPPGAPGPVGRLLAKTEADRLERADLWHVDADLADLVDGAYPSMPPFAPQPFDLPGPRGFITFARPLGSMIRGQIPADRIAADLTAADIAERSGPVAAEEVQAVLDDLTSAEVPIVAASWGPVEESALASHTGQWPAGGVWFSFYSMPMSRRDPALLGRAGVDRAVYEAMAPTLAVDNELVIAWRPDGADEDRYRITTEADFTAAWGVAVFTVFLLLRQGNLVEQAREPVPKQERRLYARAGLAEPGPVRVLRLNRTVSEQAPRERGDGPGRVYKHRWLVRGHWRNQPYPSLGVTRPKWIAPYLAGPAGAPLLGGDKVTVLRPPAQRADEPPMGG